MQLIDLDNISFQMHPSARMPGIRSLAGASCRGRKPNNPNDPFKNANVRLSDFILFKHSSYGKRW
jgi:hypothetical protein